MEITLSNQNTKPAVSSKLTKMFVNLFNYDEERLTIYGDDFSTVINKLNYAYLNRELILVTYNDKRREVLTITKLTADSDLLVAEKVNHIQKIIRLKDIFKVEFAN